MDNERPCPNEEAKRRYLPVVVRGAMIGALGLVTAPVL
jgi:hypothetical protein